MSENSNCNKNANNTALAPIALFVYKRLEHTRRTVEALQKNILADQSALFVFCDGPKSKKDQAAVQEVRSYVKSINGFGSLELIEQETNLGLSQSIIQGVTKIVEKYGKIIVLEDDLVTSPYFLQYMNDGLNVYENNQNVISIHGYVYPVKEKLPETFFLKGADCWGWATWKRAWDMFEPDGKKLLSRLETDNLTGEFDFHGSYPYSKMLKGQIAGQNDSWAIRWYASAFLANKLTLYPGASLVNNIGNDATGTHGNKTSVFETKLCERKINVYPIEARENREARNSFISYFDSLKPALPLRVFARLKRLLSPLISPHKIFK